MKLRDLLFTGMDVINESHKLLDQYNLTNGMTESEFKAYMMGVDNALNTAAALFESDEHLVFHVKGYDVIEEFDLDELIEIAAEKEEDNI